MADNRSRYDLVAAFCGLLLAWQSAAGGWQEVIELRVNDVRDGLIFQQGGWIGPSVAEIGATLKTDPELEAILEQAERFRLEKQYGIACKLWQSVLERSGDSLFSNDEKIYFSLSRQVEQLLSRLPLDEGLAAYRISADAFAKQILAEALGPFDERALQRVVRHYFLSSLGDDAAMTLSAVYMDQHDFVGASRMLEKIVSIYPDPSVSMLDVFTRLALCYAMTGEKTEAAAAIESARSVSAGERGTSRDEIETQIMNLAGHQSALSFPTGWKMPLANRSRNGVMPKVPEQMFGEKLQAVWQYAYDPEARRWADILAAEPISGADRMQRAADSFTQKERSTFGAWEQNGWRPTGELLFDEERVYCKTSMDLMVWNRDVAKNRIVWRSLWRTHYQPDDFTSSMLEVRRRFKRSIQLDAGNFPERPHEIQLFLDRVNSQMSLEDGVLYSIEGVRLENGTVDRGDDPRLEAINVMMGIGAPSRRTRSNRLTAYDSVSGRLLWTLPPLTSSDADGERTNSRESDLLGLEAGNLALEDVSHDENPWLQTGGFMSAPILYGGLLLVPVNQGGSISICALDPKQRGKKVWVSFLCDESETGANPNSPIQLSIDGSDLFVSTGMGVVFVMDPSTGLIHFAKRYERNGQVGDPLQRRLGRTIQPLKYENWLSDTVIGFGRQMVCFSSDGKAIEAHDRQTGELVWKVDFRPLNATVDYLLGVVNGVLFAAGPETILAFDLRADGRMLWGGVPLFGGQRSFGRGMLTSNAIYVPVRNEILKFSLTGKDGKAELLAKAEVELGVKVPVGNLFSDGERIWVHGGSRIFALGPGTQKSSAKVETD